MPAAVAAPASSGGRPQIPPPRLFPTVRAAAEAVQRSEPRTIPPPRQFVTAAVAGPAEPAAQPSPEPSPVVPQTPREPEPPRGLPQPDSSQSVFPLTPPQADPRPAPAPAANAADPIEKLRQPAESTTEAPALVAEPKVEPPAPIDEPKIITPAPAAEPKVEAPAPVAEPKIEAPAPAAELKIEVPAPIGEPKIITPAPAAEPKVEAPAPAAEPKVITPPPIAESQAPVGPSLTEGVARPSGADVPDAPQADAVQASHDRVSGTVEPSPTEMPAVLLVSPPAMPPAPQAGAGPQETRPVAGVAPVSAPAPESDGAPSVPSTPQPSLAPVRSEPPASASVSVSAGAAGTASGSPVSAPAPEPDAAPSVPSTPQASPAPASSAPTASAGAAGRASAPQSADVPGPPGSESGPAPSPARAATTAPVPASSAASPPAAVNPREDSQVEPTGCATCGGFHKHADGPALHESMGCDTGQCIPGRPPCNPPCNECDTFIGAFCQNLYQCLCCPDPCYQPTWVPAANASFFADYARPRTVTRIRYDNLEAMTTPDRNQFFINQVLPMRTNGRTIGNPFARLQQVYLYQEAAGPMGSFFIEYPYRQINQSWAPSQSGFGDLNFGIKSLLFDCEMLQISFQFRTYTPTGNFLNNLGTGHFSLDPSILTSLKLGPTTYFQGQFGNWIPLLGSPSGTGKLAGGVFYWFMSLNQVLWYTTPDSPLIATLEMDGWSFENGGFTSAVLPGKSPYIIEKGGGVTYFNIGPGLRQSVCNRLDFGGAITWATGTYHWAQPWFRFEVRFLF